MTDQAMSKSDMERAREWLERKQGPLVERDEVKSIASLIQEVRNETLEAVRTSLIEQAEVAKAGARKSANEIETIELNGGAIALLNASIHVTLMMASSQTQHSKEGEGK
ncbi:hypothetical protein JY97_00580 [Alkalispirochaeta odontotermitis]|nr:hypothetical protein JY97_00580 [Alkalispirochaeta odontotermitis]